MDRFPRPRKSANRSVDMVSEAQVLQISNQFQVLLEEKIIQLVENCDVVGEAPINEHNIPEHQGHDCPNMQEDIRSLT